MIKHKRLTADAWAALLAAEWAQSINLRTGSLWEPAVARYILNELKTLGDDPMTRALTEVLCRMRLGLPAPEGGRV